MKLTSRTGQEAEEVFYRLDNSAVFMASIAGTDGPLVFRLGFILSRRIDLSILESSVRALVPRFPWLFVRLGTGVFWHFLEPVSGEGLIEKEGRWPCAALPYQRKAGLVRIQPYGSRVAVEFHHVVCDGTAALTFVNALLCEYLAQAGLVSREEDALRKAGILWPGQDIDPQEGEDAYARYFSKAAPLPKNQFSAFLLPGERRNDVFRETVISIPLAPVLDYARAKRVSLTDVLCAVHLDVLQEEWLGLPARKRRSNTISVQVPINLRALYPSKTLRNFFLFSAPSIDMRLGTWEFNEILAHVHHQMRLGGEKKELLRQLKRNVGGERNRFGRPVLLPLKIFALRLINRLIGVAAYSGSLSNIGRIDLPPSVEALVSHYLFTGIRSKAVGLNVTVFSFKEHLHIVLASTVARRDAERLFAERLCSLGFPLNVDSSEPFLENQAFSPLSQ